MTEEVTGQDNVSTQPSEAVGGRLRARREELGWPLDDVVTRLKIRKTTLEAIEGERYSELPGRVYALGFIKSYASFLGLDVAKIVQQAEKELANFTPRQQTLHYSFPPPQEGRSAGLWGLLGVGLVVMVGAYAGWYHFYGHERLTASILPPHLADKTVDEPAAPSASKEAPVSAPSPRSSAEVGLTQPASTDQSKAGSVAADNGAENVDHNSPSAPAGQPNGAQQDMPDLPPPPDMPNTTAEANQAGNAPPQGDRPAAEAVKSPSGGGAAISQLSSTPSAPSQNAQSVPSAPSAPKVEDKEVKEQTQPVSTPANISDSAASTLRVHATEESWVQIINSKGKVLLARNLKPGEVWQGEAGETYHLTAGNAGGVVFQVGDNVSAPLGMRGKVVRNAVVSAAAIEQGRYGHGSLPNGSPATEAQH